MIAATPTVIPKPHSDEPLRSVFNPRSIAVVGATERTGSVGRTLIRNLFDGDFGGTVYLVNPKRTTVLGRPSWPSVAVLPGPVDLAVIATPAATVPDVVSECARKGVGAAIILSAGFRECGVAGVELERRVLQQARDARGDGRMRLIGPNCVGVAVPSAGLNATFASHCALPGSIAFLSQSGALCTAVLDWSIRENVGFSAFVSVGSMLDVGWGELIDHFGRDPKTKAIAIYMESIGDARHFLSAAREVAMSKPIIVIKAGRTTAAAKAASSHTGCLTGSDAVIGAAFERVGVLRVRTIAELFEMVEVLDMQPRPHGPNLTIVTNAGGPGVLAADALTSSGGESGALLTSLAVHTRESLDRVLPAHWSHGNPIDVLGDAGPQRYALAVRAALDDPATDALLAIVTPQAMTDPTAIARELASTARGSGKLILASWMGGDDVEAGRDILRQADIPNFGYPDEAAKAFEYTWRHSAALRALYETVTVPSDPPAREACGRVEALLVSARGRGASLLSEQESKGVLEAYGIPCVETRIARTEAEAVAVADAMGYPVVLKLNSLTITHKADVGGVRLGLYGPDAVRNAYAGISSRVRNLVGADAFLGVSVQPMVVDLGHQLIVGSSVDPQFGPVLLFGAGGRSAEVIGDTVLALPPLNTSLARRAIDRTRVGRALDGHVDMPALQRLLVRFGQLAAEQKWIREIEINPLLITPDRLIALDARVVLHPGDVTEDALPKPAIRPYPAQYTWPLQTRDGCTLTVRPVRPDDERLMVRFQESLSDGTMRCRYGGMMSLGYRTSHDRLVQSCFVDFDRQIALVVVRPQERAVAEQITAVARLFKGPGSDRAEFAIVVTDVWQGRGIGSQLLRRLADVARAEGINLIKGTIQSENTRMLKACGRAGFELAPAQDDARDITVTLDLTGDARAASAEPA